MGKIDWDLSSLFENEEELDKSVDDILTKAKKFEKLYKGKLKGLNTTEFDEAIREYELILELLGQITTYAFLKFAQNSQYGSFYAKYQTLSIKC
ncbi:MAG: oligoendopeptidase F, partial [Campylobacteraceae bacterium]|nr:oligoendopeptidase F [Campylobacteraceae bacterium]